MRKNVEHKNRAARRAKAPTLKPATIAKYLKLAAAAVAHWLTVPVDEIAVAISEGNTKIGKAFNVSLMPGPAGCGGTCANCGACLATCYAFRLLFRKTCREAWARNTALFTRDRDAFFNQVDAFLTAYESGRGRVRAFRWHVAGEIVDVDHVARIAEIAGKHPEWIFWTYSKNYDAVDGYLKEHTRPGNLVIMRSVWLDVPTPNPHGLPVFHTVEAPTGRRWVCPGNCTVCREAGRGCPAGEDTECLIH